MNAIEAHKLQASRNNKNHWQITEDDLEKWMEGRDRPPSPAGESTTESSSDTSSETTEMRVEINRLQVELKATCEQLDEVRVDRDAWRDQAQDLARRPASTEPRKGLLARIFGNA